MSTGQMVPRPRAGSPYCAFGLGDLALRDVAFGSLGPALVGFAREQSEQWAVTARLLESVATPRLRCLLADPRVCKTSAPLLGYAGGDDLVLVSRGLPVRSIDSRTPGSEILRLVSQAVSGAR